MKIYFYNLFFIFSLLSIFTVAQSRTNSPSCFTNFQYYKTKPVINLNKELNTINSLSGGEISITQMPNQSVLVQRNHCVTRYKKNEMRSRHKNWLIFKQLHLSTISGEVFNGSLPVSKQLIIFLHRFAMSSVGAIWIQKVVNFDLYLIQKQYYKIFTYNNKLLIKPTEDFLFELAYSQFYITETDANTYASGSFIAINKKFLNKKIFSNSHQKIDHLAILSHEFGHTKFGDPKTRTNIYSEAEAVQRYENPVRILNNFLPRKTYFDKKTLKSINVYTKIITKIK